MYFSPLNNWYKKYCNDKVTLLIYMAARQTGRTDFSFKHQVDVTTTISSLLASPLQKINKVNP
jgi:hypothetical protein